jgi:hypothetical protein
MRKMEWLGYLLVEIAASWLIAAIVFMLTGTGLCD